MRGITIKIFALLGIVMFCMSLQSHLAATLPRRLRTPGQRGKIIYEQTCLPCHQADAGGVPGMNPPLRKSSYVQGTPARLINILLRGLNDGVEIDGETYSNPMPSFSTVLKDEEIADVLSYLRSNFGNKAGPISKSQVSRIRQGLNK
ncbi:MAG TPA: cytochrome c [Puia sp.]|jgi:mono/diheme cytochrome c family protein|nr:cytochrome c [Puia sp.]